MRHVTIDTVLSIVNAHLKNGSLTVKNINDNLSELGMDSIAFIQMVVAIEEEFECEIPDSKLLLSEMNTVNKMMDVLQTLLYESQELKNSPKGQ